MQVVQSFIWSGVYARAVIELQGTLVVLSTHKLPARQFYRRRPTLSCHIVSCFSVHMNDSVCGWANKQHCWACQTEGTYSARRTPCVTCPKTTYQGPRLRSDIVTRAWAALSIGSYDSRRNARGDDRPSAYSRKISDEKIRLPSEAWPARRARIASARLSRPRLTTENFSCEFFRRLKIPAKYQGRIYRGLWVAQTHALVRRYVKISCSYCFGVHRYVSNQV